MHPGTLIFYNTISQDYPYLFTKREDSKYLKSFYKDVLENNWVTTTDTLCQRCQEMMTEDNKGIQCLGCGGRKEVEDGK